MKLLFVRPAATLTRFLKREDGAVTVDWVVLTAAIVGMAMWLFTVITEEQFRQAAESINADIGDAVAVGRE